ncbi:MAG: Hsp20/alpha crystallin family protein [Candidatus Zipacnadales bacterium]
MAEMIRRTRRSVFPRIFPDIDRLFGDLWNLPFWGMTQTQAGMEARKWAPQVDLYETETEVVVKAELPGIAKQDVEVVVSDGNELAIRAERKKDEEVSDEAYYRRERVFGQFERVIQLPTDIDEGSVKATFENGVLEIRATKKGPEPKGRKIEVA